jgi:hypothetical protein
VYGSKNIWNFNPNSDIRERGNCSIEINDNTYSFTATTGYDGTSYAYPKLLTVGRKYHMQFKSKFTKADSTDGRIIVTPLDSWDISGSYFNYQCTSSDADFVTKDYEFTATAEKLVFNVYVQFGTGSGNKFELKDLMIYDVDACLDNSYTPYAKTNVELTQNVANVLPVVNDAIEITTTENFANLKNGITYKFSESDTGSPFNGYSVAVIVAKVASTSGVQIAYKVVSAANTNLDLVAVRPCLSGNYGPWRKFSGVIPT